MKSVAIIPARGGSKRIPRKNIRDFLGKPIIAYPIEAALRSGLFAEVMVSTDDVEIAEIATKYGATVPFYRSAEMSSDAAATAPVLIEVLDEYLKRGVAFDNCCCMYPCSPFVTAYKLQEGMRLLITTNAQCVLPVVKYSYPPQRSFVIRDGRAEMLHPENYYARSQDLEAHYHDTGQFYFLNIDSLREQRKLFCKHSVPMIISENDMQDIDNEEDWIAAEIKYKIRG